MPHVDPALAPAALDRLATACGSSAIDRDRASALLPRLVALLTTTTTTTTTDPLVLHHALRLVANACIDHPDNRSCVLRAHGLDALLRLLASPPPPHHDVTKLACGALINLAVDTPDVQAQLHATAPQWLPALLPMLDPSSMLPQHRVHVYVAARLLSTLLTPGPPPPPASSPATCLDQHNPWLEPHVAIPSAILRLARHVLLTPEEHQDVLWSVLPSLVESISAHTPAIQLDMMHTHLFHDILAVFDDPAYWDALEMPDDTPSGQLPPIEAASRHWLNAAVHASLHDASASWLLNQHPELLHRLLAWLHAATQAPHDMSMPMRARSLLAVLCLGNVACTEPHCLALAQAFDALRVLLQLLAMRHQDAQLSDAALAMLRNLTLPSANRALAATLSDPVATVGRFLPSRWPSVPYHTVRVLKNLTAGHEAAGRMAHAMVTCHAMDANETVWVRLLGVVRSSDHAGVQGEGSRVLMHVVKQAYASEADATMKQALVEALHRDSPVPLLTRLVRTTPHAILKHESVLALVLLAADDVHGGLLTEALLDSSTLMVAMQRQDAAGEVQDAMPTPAAAPSLLEALLAQLKAHDAPPLRANVAALLSVLVPRLRALSTRADAMLARIHEAACEVQADAKDAALAAALAALVSTTAPNA